MKRNQEWIDVNLRVAKILGLLIEHTNDDRINQVLQVARLDLINLVNKELKK